MSKKGANDSPAILHVLALAAIVTIVLVPFSAKPFHVDDPMYLWAARHILKDPVNFYGFNVNWLNLKTSMADVMKNPPLVSYYIALAASVVGWGERAIHLAMIVPAVAAAAGIYFIAKRICARPLLATLIGVLSPAFIVSGTTVMSDVMMLAFWCWAVVLWMRGVENDDAASLAVAGVLVAMSALTKYFGMSLVPLLAAYSIFAQKKPLKCLMFLVIPAVILAGYQWATHAMYGKGLLFDAADYAVSIRYEGGTKSYIQVGFISLAFIGGCVITGLFYMPLLWSKRAMGAFAALAGAIALALITSVHQVGVTSLLENGHLRWDVIIELSLFAVAGASIMVLSIGEFFRRRDAAALLLALWVAGTFVFAAFLNWTVSGRTVLPIAPAAGMIFARRMEEKDDKKMKAILKLYLPLVPTLITAVFVAWADYDFAKAERFAANYIYAKYANGARHIWFQKHWGFQYYMESHGEKAVAIDWHDSHISKGDIVVFSLTHYRPGGHSKALIPTIETLSFTPSGGLATVDPGTYSKTTAGFYSSTSAALPYFLGPQSGDIYLVKQATIDGDLRLPFDLKTTKIPIDEKMWTRIFGDDL